MQRLIALITFFCLSGGLPLLAQFHPDPIEAAHDHYHERRYTEAIEAYQVLLEKGIPRGEDAYTPLHQNQKDSIRLMLGQSYAKTGEDPAAHRVYMSIVDENPNGSYATQAVHRLGTLYWERYQFTAAIRACKQILNQHGDTGAAAAAGYLLGRYQHAQGQSADAIDSYTYFLEAFPHSPYRVSVINSLIQLYTTHQRYAEAETLIREQMQRSPDDLTRLEQLAELYRQQNAYEKALTLYRDAVARDPSNRDLRQKLGDLYAEIGDTEAAVEEWRKTFTQTTDPAEQYQHLGAKYLAHKMYPEAITAYREAIRLRPRSSYLYTQLAAAYKIQGDVERAAGVYSDALQQVGFNRNQRETIWAAMLEIYEGETAKALRETRIAAARTLLARSPGNPNIKLTLGELLFYAGEVDAALETFVRLHRTHPPQMDMMLETYAQVLARKEHPKAADFYEALITGSRNRTRLRNVRTQLAGLYEKMGQPDKAIAVLETLVSTGEATVRDQLRLGTLQLRGVRDPEAAAQTLEPLRATGLLEVQLGLAECYLLLKRYAPAREILDPIAAQPNRLQAAALKLLGDSYFFSADFDQAAAVYKRVIGISKSDQLTNNALERVVLIQSHSDYLKAPLTDYATAVRLLRSGQDAAALQQCERSLEMYPEATIVDAMWLLIGDIHSEAGAVPEAILAYQQVVEREGLSVPKALVSIADIYRHAADFRNAAATYTRLITEHPEAVMVAYARQQLDAIWKLEGKRASD